MLGNRIRGYIRIALVLPLSFVALLLVIIRGALARDKIASGQRVRNWWSGSLLSLMGFKVEKRGHIPEGGPYLFVGNHRSTLDPMVALKYLRASPVSRADVRHYPVIGKGAELSGIIFIDKTSRTSRTATKQAIYDALKAGISILIFPEGTTHGQPLTTTFQKGAFEMAAELGVEVVPFAIEYKSIADYWDHTDGMVTHYLKNLAKPRTDVRISFGPVLQGDTAWSLLRQSQQWVNDEIVRLREDWGGLAAETKPNPN